MKNLNRCFSALLLFFLSSASFQKASAEGYLYLFKKNFPGDFAVVEAVQEEKSEGNIKLTTAEGKLSVWQETMLAAKFPLFDEAREVSDPAAIQVSIDAMEKLSGEEPGTKMYLQGLINQRKELLARLQNKTVETTQTAGDALERYLSDGYNEERVYSLEYLEAKLRRGERFKQDLPAEAARISDYLKPWAEELQNRKAGLERYNGKWVNTEEVAQMKAERTEADRKAFFDKEIDFKVPLEAISQKAVYIFLLVIGISVLIMFGILITGLRNLSSGFGLSTILALVFGLGGLAAYGYAAWILFQPPLGYVREASPQGGADVLKRQENLPVDEFIFLIHQDAGNPKPTVPGRYLLQEPELSAFLKKYLKLESSSKPEAYAVTRRGLKVRILVDRILVFDELTWFKKNVVMCYSFFYANSSDGFEFFKTEASAGGVPLPGRIFKHLWEQVQPTVGEVITESKVLDNYHVSRMESGMIELISNRNPPKPATP